MRAGRWAEGFWGVAGAASIRVKVMGIVIGLILMLGVPVTLVVRQGLSAALGRELEERGVAIALSLASRSQELVLTDRLLALYTLAKETVKTNKGVLYAYVTDARGAVLVHTFEDGMPEGLLSLPPLADGVPHRVRPLSTEADSVKSSTVGSMPIWYRRGNPAGAMVRSNPRAARIANSCWRPSVRISSRFATFPQAMRRTMPAAASSIQRTRRTPALMPSSASGRMYGCRLFTNAC